MGRRWVGCVKFSLAGPAIVTGHLAGEMDMSHQFRKPQLLDFFILLVLSVIWGSAFGAIKIAVDGTAPFTVVAARTIIGGIGVCVWLMITGSWRLNWQGLPWGRLCLIALLGTLLPFFLIRTFALSSRRTRASHRRRAPCSTTRRRSPTG